MKEGLIPRKLQLRHELSDEGQGTIAPQTRGADRQRGGKGNTHRTSMRINYSFIPLADGLSPIISVLSFTTNPIT